MSLEKHKDQPVPYKYKKWKARDNEAREERGKKADIQRLLNKTNQDKAQQQLGQLTGQPIKSLLDRSHSDVSVTRNDVIINNSRTRDSSLGRIIRWGRLTFCAIQTQLAIRHTRW